MQFKKKVLTIAITALLLLAMTMAVAQVHAITAPDLTPGSGPVGTVVTVSGVDAVPFSTVTIHWDNLAGAVLNTTSALATGAYSVEVTVPSATNGDHFVVASDSSGNAGAAFTVDASLVALPAQALPGDSLTLTGNGFAATSAITVTFDSTTLATPVSITLTTPTITSNATGSFSAVVTVPAAILVANFDTYTVTAEDAATNLATDTVAVGYYVTVTPTSGPPGITVTIAGRITASTAVVVKFGTAVAFSTTSGTTGSFTGTYALTGPIILGTAYDVTATFGPVATPTVLHATFTTNAAAPAITLGVAAGIPATVVTIAGTDFSPSANITLSFGTTVVNSTATDKRFGPTDTTGAFSENFAVPNIAVGAYTVTVVDQYGASATSAFTITAPPVTTVALRATSYAQGDTLSFKVYTTETSIGTVTVTVVDPTKLVFWTNVWTVTGPAADGSSQVLYQDQLDTHGNHLTLPLDAATGSWNWTITYTPASTATLTTATGLFAVVPGGLSGVVSTIGGLNSTLQAIQGTITTIQGNVATIQSSVGGLSTITASVSSLGAQITGINDAIAVLYTSMGTLTTAVGNLNATLIGINGNVATVQTSVGTLQGTITTIQGNVATVQTNVGAIQASLGTLQSSVNTLQSSVNAIPTDVPAKADVTGLSTAIWIAVIFAIIAAIAAIASIVIVRQKVAG